MLEGPHVGWPHLPGASRRWLVRPLATPVVHTCGWAVNVLLAHWSGPRGGDARAPVGRLLVKIIAPPPPPPPSLDPPPPVHYAIAIPPLLSPRLEKGQLLY